MDSVGRIHGLARVDCIISGFIDGPPPLIPSRVRNRRVLKMREFLCHSTKKYRVTISYVTRLSLFYVHLADKQQILQELQRDLDGFYKEVRLGRDF